MNQHAVNGRDVTIVVTCHTPRVRNGLLSRCLESVWKQTRLPDAVSIAIDQFHEGAAVTRNRALNMADTEWVVFVDSDDILYPNYLQRMLEHQTVTGADVLWPWFNVSAGNVDPFPIFFGKQYDRDKPHIFPITTLIRREFAVKVGGFPEITPVSNVCLGEDFPFWKSVYDAGAKFSHLPERLWEWNHRPPGGNTSGLGSRW